MTGWQFFSCLSPVKQADTTSTSSPSQSGQTCSRSTPKQGQAWLQHRHARCSINRTTARPGTAGQHSRWDAHSPTGKCCGAPATRSWFFLSCHLSALRVPTCLRHDARGSRGACLRGLPVNSITPTSCARRPGRRCARACWTPSSPLSCTSSCLQPSTAPGMSSSMARHPSGYLMHGRWRQQTSRAS